ncbi:MAG: hypothetical protein ACXAE3_13370, partial [Candidatus Kariarchaeaceae archaeon]
NSLTPTTSGAWSSGVPVNYNIDSLTKGSYNITFLFIDESSNTNKVEFTITVEDQTIPSIDSSSVTGTTISEVSSNNWVNVTASDSYAQTYEIYVNSLTPTTSGVWTSGIAVNYNIDSLTKGTYNITFLFIDESSNTNKIEFSITVQDQTSPQFSGSSTSGTPISDLDSNTWINITVTDIYPSTYEVYENSLVANFSGSWSSGVSLNFNLEHLDKGVFNITFVFYDESGNIYTTQFSITVQDTTIPIISDSVSPPGDITEASSNNWINVTSTDKYASVYEIYVNSPSVTSTGAWTSGVSVDYNLDSLTRGLYNITFLFIDEDGNSERIQFLINVIDATNPEIQISLSPSVDITEVSIGNWINVTTTDNYADVYEIWVNGVLNGSKSFVWTSGISVDFNLDKLVKGTYNVTFVFIDESSNRVTTVYTITVIDITVPIVESVQTTSLNTNEGESGNWINVTASDSYAATYEIWVNGVRNGSQAYPWSSNVAVNLNIDYLTLGTYNVTFIFYDESGNSQRTQVDINVFDITLPDVSNTGDIPAYIEGSGSNWINWTATDNHADNYAIYRNNSLIDIGSWSSGTPINLDIDGLAKNYYVYTISVYDTTGNLRNSTVYVTVIDTTLPSISSDGDFSISEGATGEVVSWTGFDVNFDTYTIDIDGLFNTSGFWNNDDPVTYLLDGFLKGTYVFTLTLFDTSGNSFNTSISVDVLDTTNPVVDTLTTTTYEEGTTGNILTWTATDNYPATYSAKIDGVEVASGVWSSGIGIVVSIDGLLLGEYVVSITIIDVSGNQVSSGTIVRIFEITPPSFISDQYYNYTYVEGTSGHLLNWTVTDPYAGTYVYFRNNVQRGGGSWNSGTEVSINIDGLVKGVYNFTIYFRDTSLNTIRSTVLVTVIDTKVPAVSTTDSYLFRRGTAGNEVSWIATDLYPDIYAVYLNGSQIVTGASWSSGSPISVSGDALEIGIYNFTVVFFDRSGNSNSSTSIISMVDGVPAILISGANDLDFDEGSIGNTLTWMYSDPSPANYIILENGTQIDSQPWVANVSFSFVLDDLQKGVYNITLVVYDQAGNIATYTNIITVLDATLPTFVSQPVASFNYTEQDTGFSLSWTMSDKYDGTYEILRNGTILQTGSWVTDDPRTISIDGLSYGHYNYTMVVWDASGNQILDTVLVSVFDETLPEILSEISPDLYYEGRTGYLLNWSVFDIHGFNYTVDVNGEVYATGSWNESQFIVIDIDGLAYGTYNFTITIMDESLNSATEWVEIDVLDDTFPDMTLSQEAVTFILDTTGNTISWTATDLNPGSFVVYLEGNIVYLTNTWVSNEPIVISVDGFNAGYYNFSIVIADQALNEIRDSVIVRIKDPTLVDTILPEFEIEQEVYEGDIEIINGTWVDIDGNPITNGEITISLFLQDKIRSRVVFTDDQGQYGLIFNYTGLLPGFYTWVVDFEAEGYESWTELERYAALLPHGLSIELFFDTDIVRGEEYFITAILKYNNRNDSTGLSLSELVGREGIAEGVEVEFFISILKLDGTTAFYSLSNFTNAEGVVKVFLTSAQTREADELLDIVATIISTDGFQSSSSSLPEEDKPVVRPPPPTVIEQALQFIQDNSFLILLVSVGIVFILAFAVILQKRRQDRIMELNTAIKLSYDEVRALESMKAIIIQTKSKLTIYEELVNEEGMN